MDLKEAIEARHSRRSYLPTALDPAVVEQLQHLITQYSQEANLRMELVLDNGAAFAGLLKSYGMFTGVRHYIGLIYDKDDTATAERLGYYGELLVLNAVALGLGTCWVGGSFSRASCPFELTGNQNIISTITLGNTEPDESAKERLIYNMVHRNSKSMREMYASDEEVPEWFLSGMHAVHRAPSAANRQPVHFEFKEGQASAHIEDLIVYYNALDLGIAKCHFEIGAGGGSWDWGNHAVFKKG